MFGLKMSISSSLSRLPNGKASQLQLLQIHSKFLFVRFLTSYAFRALHSNFLWKYFLHIVHFKLVLTLGTGWLHLPQLFLDMGKGEGWSTNKQTSIDTQTYEIEKTFSAKNNAKQQKISSIARKLVGDH